MRRVLGVVLIAVWCLALSAQQKPQEKPQQLRLSAKEKEALQAEAMGRYGKAWRLYLEAFVAAVRKGDKASLATAEVFLHRVKSLFEQQARPDFAILAEKLGTLKKDVKDPLLSAYIRLYRAEALLACGQPAEAQAELAGLGFVRDWFVIGPFENERGIGFSEKYPPEKELKLTAEYQGKRRTVRWRPFSITSPMPVLDFDAIMRPNEQVLAYALCFVHSEKEQTVALRLGSDEGFKLFVNGKETFVRDCHRDFFWDQDAVAVVLRKGWNSIMVKVAEDKGEWKLALRITALDGSPVEGLKFARTIEEAKGIKVEGFKEAKGEPSIGARAYFAEAAKKGDITAHFHLGYLHIAYHWQDISLHMDRQHLMKVHKACPKDAIVAYWVSATYIARRAEMEAEKREIKRKEFMLKALSLKPDYVEALCELGRYYLERLRMWRRAREYMERALKANPTCADALLLELEILRAREFEVEREAVLMEMARANPPDELVAEAVMALERQGKVKQAEQLLADLWRRRMNFPGLLERYVTFLRDHNRDQEALALLDSFILAYPYIIQAYRTKAEILYSRDRFEEAAETLEKALAFCPEDLETLLAYGKTLLRLSLERGEEKDGPTYKKALSVLRDVLRVDPTNAWVKRYLEFVGGSKRLLEEMDRFADRVRLENDRYVIEDRYMSDGEVKTRKLEVPVKELEAMAKKENAPYVCVFYRLLLEVTPRATSSEHHYIVLRVMNERGAENLKSLSCTSLTTGWNMDVKVKEAKIIRKDGTVEEARVRAGTAEYHNLQPGDTVMLSFRADERATEEAKFFGDYYGQIIYLNPTGRLRRFFFFTASSDLMPVKFSKLTLVLPRKEVRPIHIYQKNMTEKPTEEAGIDDKTRVLVWRLYDLPLLVQEPYMPPLTQTIPNVQISTFYDWGKFGKWFWNLIKKQFETSEKLKKTVAELIKDKKSQLEKVHAIARFAIEKIRYEEAASFDIHGWKPYKAAQILERGNGDCKDKSILFVTMMREAGLKAYVVLVKSQLEGRGHPDLTLPLIRHFNHAIVYVPATDEHPELWLDLTAEKYTLSEMPPESVRGAVAFVVGEDMAELKTIPHSKKENTQHLEATVDVGADGKARFHIKASVTGMAASYLRTVMEEQGRRKERIENSLNEKIANFRLLKLTLPDLKDVQKSPFVWEMEGEAEGFVVKTAEGPGIRPLPLDRKWGDDLAGLQTRKLPLALPSLLSLSDTSGLHPVPFVTVPGTYRQKWLYRFAGHRIKSLPRNLNLQNRYIQAKISYRKLTANSVEVNSTLTFKTTWVGLKGYHQLRQSLAKLDQHLRHFVILEPTK